MTTKNKISIDETLHIEDIIKIQALKNSEYIRINQNSDIFIVRTDEISHLISSLQRFLENGGILDE